MNPEALTPWQRAHVDQVLALVNEVPKAWPYNEHLLNDDEVERVALEMPRGGCERSDRAYLIYQNERVVELDHALTDHDIVRQVTATAPRGQQECDRCRVVVTRAAGVAVIAMGPVLLAFILCATCATELNPDVLIPVEEY